MRWIPFLHLAGLKDDLGRILPGIILYTDAVYKRHVDTST